MPDFGYLTLVAGLVHGVLHAARYIYADTSGMMYNTDAGRSGLIACFLLLPIVLPMRFEVFRTKVRDKYSTPLSSTEKYMPRAQDEPVGP